MKFVSLLMALVISVACSNGKDDPETGLGGSAGTEGVGEQPPDESADDGQDPGNVIEPDAGVVEPDAGNVQAPEIPSETVVEYATVAVIDLPSLGFSSGVKASQVSVASGAADSLTVVDDQIRFITPSDPGEDTHLELSVSLPQGDVAIPVTVQSARPSDVVAYVEPAEDGSYAGEVPVLRVQGMGPTNALEGDDLSFSVAGAPPLDVGASSATIYNPLTGTVIDIASFWTYDAQDNELVVVADDVTALLAALPAADVEVNVALTSLDGEFAYAWSFNAHKPVATLLGSVVDIDGAVLTTLTGRQMAIRGLDNRTRRVVTVAADGTFDADRLVEGTYDVTLLDPASPGFWKATVPIFPGATEAELAFPYVSAPTSTSGAMLSVVGGNRLYRSSVSQDGVAPPSRVQPVPPSSSPPSAAQLATPADCETLGEAGAASYQAIAATQNSTITCQAQPLVAQGTQRLGLRVDVTSAEFPSYTTVKSQFNDSWSYAVGGLPGLGSAGGLVNDSHYTQGSITKQVCLDVAALTAASDYSFSVSLAATNVGDSALATSVTLTLSPGCSDELSVTDATFSSPNTAGHHIIRPLGAGNLINNYFSIPIDSAQSAWGIPLTVRFAPKQAEIVGVKLGVMVAGAPVLSSEELLPQVSSQSPGVLRFNSLIIPQFAIGRFSGKTNVVVQLTGTLDGESVVSVASDGAISFNSERTFIPLFLAGDAVGEERRYNILRDPGGDSWSTANTIDWLLPRPYRFDDVSGLHVAQLANGRSALDHAGHSDGTQIDMRYADGQGGFTESLGGAGNGSAIQALLVAASAEAAGGNPTGANVQNAINWVTANRTMIETEAALARKIHAGPSWMKLALYDGKFPDGSLIPTVGVWLTKPSIVSFVAPHLHHWHISLKDI